MPPMHGPRGTQVARTLGALVPLGWTTSVVCLDPRRGGPHWPGGADVALPDGVEAVRVPSPEEWTVVRAAWRLLPALRDRPDSKWVWIHRAASAAEARAAATPFAGLVTFAQPFSDHLVGLRVHRSTKLPWVAHFSDPWVDSPYLRVSPAQRRAAERMEADVIREAEAIVFVTSETADLVMKKYPEQWRTKVSVVPHGFDAAFVAPGGERRPGPMRMVYTGRFYDGLRTPDSFLRAIAQLNVERPLADTLDVTFVGAHVTGFARAAAALGIDRFVHFRDRVSVEDARAMAADADVLLIIDAPTSGPSPFLPSKLVDYLPLRKPMLGVTPTHGASASLLSRLGCPVAAPGDEAGLRAAIVDLLRSWREGALGVTPQFDRVAGEFDIRRTASVFSDVLTQAFGQPGSSAGQ
jgi:hypothetical protein